MAIQTQGHQVQIMPQYTAMDPNRVTFDPTGFTRGALGGIEIIQELAKRKAFLDAQAELAATREGRLGAMNAQNLATIQLAPQRNIADILLAQQQAALIPGQTKASLADQEFAAQLRPFLERVKQQKAETADALAATESDTEIAKADLEAANLARQAEAAPLEHAARIAKLSQEIDSIANDKKLTDAQKIATIRNLNASALQSEASAAKMNRGEDEKVNLIKELDDVQLQIQRLKNEPVLNPGSDNLGTPMPLIKYQGQTRGPDGNILQTPGESLIKPWTWGDVAGPVALNKSAENAIKQIKILEDRRDAITAALAGAAPSAQPQTSAQPAKTSSGAKTVTTKAEFDALKPGEPFIWNGKQGIKTK